MQRAICGPFAFALLSATFFLSAGCNKKDEARQPAPAPTSGAEPKKSGLLRVGDEAPVFSGTTHTGEVVKSKDLEGKVVVLYFYPKDNTPGCTTEARGFRDAHESYAKLDAVIIGVSTQDNESHRSFAEEHGLPFLLLPDEDGAIAKSFGVGSFLGLTSRVTFLIDKTGKIAKVYENVAPKNHAEEVLADINVLTAK